MSAKDQSGLDYIEVAVEGSRHYHLISQSSESTVVTEFVPDEHKQTEYQSEADLECEFITTLQSQAYERLSITSELDLIRNLKVQLEKLNDIRFSDAEWERFFKTNIASENDSIEDKTARIQEDHVQLLRRDDGSTKNVRLIDKDDIHNNSLQVLNQYEAEGTYANRYDVTILVNGLPLVHVELKRRGAELKEAFNQISRYQRESFWAGSGLYEYVQIFVISNGTFTKYYSNTTRNQHIKEAVEGSKRTKKTSHSYEFTSWWADANNRPITDLAGFSKTFFAKHTLLNILTKYCVFTSERLLLVMRPYQIVATERILKRIEVATNYHRLGTLGAGGYVWHTTGSGKTLTSFKTAQLATRMPGVEKVLFVVDRKDLDYQTMKEYDKFEKGAANSNTSTLKLKGQLEDPNARIIITTIQKLSRFISQNKEHEVYHKHIVIIFDECHRSQFGDMHVAIKKAFRKYHLFGFTGTPIFSANAQAGGKPHLKTTEQAFGDKLHTYTIVDAISDRNVLPFRIDYVETIKMPDDVADKKVPAIDRERALLDPRRIRDVVGYILAHFDQKTKRNQSYRLKDRRLSGFNSIFATPSIDAAKLYYAEFKRQLAEGAGESTGEKLKVALIYSFAANEEEPDGLLAEEQFEVDGLDASSRDFLDAAIADYNAMFTTNFDTSSDGFQNYHKDLSQRIRDREVDLTIVVNMFLTGFDATTLNTLWVDKNLQKHGLLQAFSRTNRILNSVKTFGNIVCFRNLEQATNDAIALFGDRNAQGVVLLKPFGDYFEEYQRRIAELLEKYPLGDLGDFLIGEEDMKDFIRLYGAILRLKNILQSFDDFEGREILSPRDFQNYQSVYLELYDKIGRPQVDKEIINDDIVFEIELIKQVEINIDYILMLVHKYHDSNCEDREILVSIDRAVGSSVNLRNKKDLIEQFVNSLAVSKDVDREWCAYISVRKAEELDRIITEENLRRDETLRFVEGAFRDGAIQASGIAFADILPPVSYFTPAGDRAIKKQVVLKKLQDFFSRFYGICP